MLLRAGAITAIARAVGNDTDAAFGNAFKKYAGTTPGELRRQAQAPDATEPPRATPDEPQVRPA